MSTARPRRHLGRNIVLGIGLFIVIGGVGYGLWAWHRPLGPTLQTLDEAALAQPLPTVVNTAPPPPTEEALADPSFATAIALATVVPSPTLQAAAPTTLPAATPLGGCGTGQMTLLVLGSDTRLGDYKTGRADFIRAVRVDFEQGYARILSIPRDLWVPIPYLKDYGIIEGRINATYSYGNYYQLPGGGVSLMATTLDQNFGLKFDHYVVVNFEAVEKGVDAIGGVDIEVPKDIDGTLQYLPYFKAGQYHMDGATLMQYVRVRYSDNDLYRMDRQNQVILAIREKLLRPEVVGAVPGLTTAMLELIYTDLTPAEVTALVCLGQKMDLENLLSLKIGAGYEVVAHTTAGGANVLLPIRSEIAKLVEQFNAP